MWPLLLISSSSCRRLTRRRPNPGEHQLRVGAERRRARTWVSPYVLARRHDGRMPVLLFWPVHILLSLYAPKPA